MEMERGRRSPTPRVAAVSMAATATAVMLSVLGDDNLLREILLRVNLVTSLLRAALVCRRWYRHASDPAFLRRFRDRHPPRLLGTYLNTSGSLLPRFIPVRPLPELAAAARRAGSFLDAFRGSSTLVRDSRGGRLLVTTTEDNYGHLDSTDMVCSPLSPSATDTVVVPPSPSPPAVQLTGLQDPTVYHYGEFLPVDVDGGDGRSYSCVLVGYGQRQAVVRLYELEEMNWVVRASAAAELPLTPPRLKVMLLDESKFYILSTTNKILVCDFPSSSISVMDLPNGVEEVYDGSRSIVLSRGDGSGIFLVHVKRTLLRVFHCRSRTEGDSSGDWSLVGRKVCANLGIKACASSGEGEDGGVTIHAAGDGAKFVFLEMFGAVVFLDLATTQAEKVYEIRPENKELLSVHPLMLPSPVFPPLKEG